MLVRGRRDRIGIGDLAVSAEPRSSRVDDAYEQLKREILDNVLPPGFQALEAEIALKLRMSRTPVREALIRLEAEGLVELIPRRGVRVTPISPDDMREIYEILTALEPQAAATVAVTGLTEEQVARLEAIVSDMAQALDAEDLDAWADADDQFHRTLLELGSNRRLIDFVKTLLDQSHRARVVTLRLRELPIKSTDEHRRILDRLAAGDADGTHSVFREHRQRAAKELLDILERCRLTRL